MTNKDVEEKNIDYVEKIRASLKNSIRELETIDACLHKKKHMRQMFNLC